MRRKLTRRVKVGNVEIGGGAPVSVQGMAKTDTRDVSATVHQISMMEQAGCEIVRVAVPDMEAAEALARIKSRIGIPLVADIHYDYRLALKALEAGVDKLRINPGNIVDADRVKQVVAAARGRKVPIRIGVNAGSLEKDLLARYGHPCAEAMVESALRHVALLERLGFHEIVISLKASDVTTTVEAYELISDKLDYPLHVGITESGTAWAGTIRSAVGIGALLYRGIGDTVRVSLTADPVEEIRVAYEILKSLGLRQRGPVLISCPTCGRCEIDLTRVAAEVEKRLAGLEAPIKVAVMGCVVNGPGEAREADVGLAGGRGVGLLFRHGQVVRKVRQEEMVEELWREIERITGGGEHG